MPKKWVTIFIFLFLNSAHAETCPTISDLKSQHLNHWQLTDFGSAMPASRKKIKHFIQNVSRYFIATWDFDEFGRCFYEGEKEDASDLGVFLQKETSPDTDHGNWKPDRDSWTCGAGIQDCWFKQ
jgi:hypothetical protein